MADQNKRLDSNVAGNFYVDATCINCDTCRQLAPASFEEVGDFSAVTSQPTDEGPLHQAYQALLSCPVGSIGTEQSEPARMQEAMASFPLHLEDGVYYCGFNSEKSFGANSFFLEHPDGNWLIDSPRYLKHLVEAFERKGGLSYIFLTHKDDVAEVEKYAAHFGAKRIIHRADLEAAPGAEWIIEDVDSSQVLPQFQIIPVPGHTAGSMALLYQNRFLFTGDHLWWDSKQQMLRAPSQLVWRKRVLLDSLQKLLDYRFEWVLAGHGDRVRLSAEAMQSQLQTLIERRQPARMSP
ncbi:MAG: MBL fold metallo-hydrolase [Nitrospirae bacterium]|nr:MBL fold metallo-hydrolase [Nitrospirota bacterium]